MFRSLRLQHELEVSPWDCGGRTTLVIHYFKRCNKHSILFNFCEFLLPSQYCESCRKLSQWHDLRWSTAAAAITCSMMNLTINHYTIQRVGFPMMLVLICCGLWFFQNFRRKKNLGAQSAQQEMNHYIITGIVHSNLGFQTWQCTTTVIERRSFQWYHYWWWFIVASQFPWIRTCFQNWLTF